MISFRTKSLLSFIFSTLLFILIIFSNFYSSFLFQDFPYIYFIPIASTVIILLVAIALASWAGENDRLKYEFITIVTHKFRTPLTGIKWSLANLRNNLTLRDKENLIKRMETANMYLLEIVDLLVDFVKFDSRLEYAYEAVSLRDLVGVSLDRYAEYIHNKNIRFTINTDSSIPLIIIDRRKIQFAIDMLFDNAIKYTPPHGEIEVTIQGRKGIIIFTIKDNGIGIRPEDMNRIFKRFFRSAEAKQIDTEGMGLGLSIAKAIVEKHKGKMWAGSEGVSKGATFYIQLKTKG